MASVEEPFRGPFERAGNSPEESKRSPKLRLRRQSSGCSPFTANIIHEEEVKEEFCQTQKLDILEPLSGPGSHYRGSKDEEEGHVGVFTTEEGPYCDGLTVTRESRPSLPMVQLQLDSDEDDDNEETQL